MRIARGETTWSRLPTAHAMGGLLAAWSALGIVASLQVWTKYDHRVGLPFLLLLHVPHWSFWAPLTLLVWVYHQRLAASRKAPVIVFYSVSCTTVIGVHSAFVALWDVLVAGTRAAAFSWTSVFVNHLQASAATEALGFFAVAMAMRAMGGRRESPGGSISKAPAAAEEPETDRHRVGLSPLAVRVGNSTEMVTPDEIRYLEAAGNYVRVHTTGGRLVVRGALSSVLSRLDGRFVRIHRSRAVNIDHVKQLRSSGRWNRWVVLRDGREVKASETGWRRLSAPAG